MPAAPEPSASVRPAGREDVPAILELLRTCLGPTLAGGTVPRTEALWRWKHERNPFGVSPVLLAESTGRVVAVRAFLRWHWRSGAREVPAVRAVDTATHPDWRGRGLFSRLTLRLLDEVSGEGAAFVFNTPNRASRPGYLKMGWRPVGRIPVLTRPCGSWSTVGRIVGRAARAAPDLDHFPPARELLRQPDLDGLIEATEKDPERRLRTARSRDYLSWRYADPPGIGYRALWSGPGEAPAAVFFRGRLRGKLREIIVSEILIPEGRDGVRSGARLLRRLAQESRADYLAAAASGNSPERSALLRTGFLPVPVAGPRLVVRTLGSTPGASDPGKISAWRVDASSFELF